jgi:hypothetical protein
MIARPTRVASALVAFVTACTVFACSSSSRSTSAGPSNACEPAPASFQKDVMPIFAQNCTSTAICHGQPGDAQAENLYLGLSTSTGTNGPSDVAAVYTALVGSKSVEDPSMNFVTAGDLEDSFLWHKVTGDENSDPKVESGCLPQASGPNPCEDCLPAAPCGVQMPLGSILDPSLVCILQNWITEGAQND